MFEYSSDPVFRRILNTRTLPWKSDTRYVFAIITNWKSSIYFEIVILNVVVGYKIHTYIYTDNTLICTSTKHTHSHKFFDMFA